MAAPGYKEQHIALTTHLTHGKVPTRMQSEDIPWDQLWWYNIFGNNDLKYMG